MGVRDYWVLESFIQTLAKNVKGYKTLSTSHRAKMAFYIWIAGTSRREHKKEDGYMSIGYMDLERGFGRRGFKAINDALNIFDVTPNWSQAEKLTKGYRLTEQVKIIKNKYISEAGKKISRLITLDGKAMHSLPEAIASKDLDNVTATAWKEAKPLNNIPVDLEKMKELQAHLDRMVHKKTSDLFVEAHVDDITYRVEIIGQLIKLAQTDVAGRGFIAHRYAEGRTGRLYARGISLQTAPRIIRKAALHGLYDYDIENCHYAIFYQLAASYNFECDAIKHYLGHKKQIRESIANSVGITIEQAKMCLLALMFGARLSEWENNAIPAEIGTDKAKLLFVNTLFKAIADDVMGGRKEILKRCEKRTSTLLNVMNKSVRLAKPANVRLAHIIQGIEAKALRAAIKLYTDEVVLLMHDGFVSKRPLDVRAIEQAIYDDTGMRLEVAGGVIDLPADLDFIMDLPKYEKL